MNLSTYLNVWKETKLKFSKTILGIEIGNESNVYPSVDHAIILVDPDESHRNRQELCQINVIG